MPQVHPCRSSDFFFLFFFFSSPPAAVVRIFTQWMATGQFLNSKAASKKKDKSAVLRTLEGLLQQQYKSEFF
jgi:hypothetical protein